MAAISILVVDDNATNRKLVAYVLAEADVEVIEAADAQEAAAVLERSVPDLILMDIQMPGMDGLSLTRMIKAHPSYRQVRVVALTAFAMPGDEEKAREAGCDGYITKPIDTFRLPGQIAGFLRPTLPGPTPVD
jgi:CheY-like chemotaxis protein